MSSAERPSSREPQRPSIFVSQHFDVREIETSDLPVESQEEESQRQFDKTIFTELLERYSLQKHTRRNASISPLYWPRIGRGSKVEELILDLVFIDSQKTKTGYVDIYTGLALAIEVNPDGELLFHANRDPKDSGLFLPQISWIGDSVIQKNFFQRTLLDTKPIEFIEAYKGPDIHD